VAIPCLRPSFKCQICHTVQCQIEPQLHFVGFQHLVVVLVVVVVVVVGTQAKKRF
jgi:hypothetical protein